MADLKAKVTFLADTKGLIKGVDAVSGRFTKLGKTLETHSAAFLRAGAAMGAAIGGLATQGIAYGTTIDRMAEMTGAAHEEMSRLAYSAELYHGEAAMVEKGTKRLAKAMSDARDGLATYQRAFDKTGISVTDAEGNLRNVTDVMLDLSDYMSSNANNTEKLATAYDLLGGRQSALIPWMKQGSAAIREQFEEADRLGLTLDSETAKSLEHMGTSVKKLKIAMRGVGVVVATAVLPVVEDLAFKAIAAMMAFQKWTPEAKRAAIETVGLGAAGLIAAGVVGKLVTVLGSLGVSAGTALAGLGGSLIPIGIGLGAMKLNERFIEPALAATRASRELTDANMKFTAGLADLTVEAERTGMSAAALEARQLWLYRSIYQNIEGAQNFEGVLDGTAAALDATADAADPVKTLLDKVRDAFDEAAGAAAAAKTPFDEFLETMGLEQVVPLEDYAAAMASLNATLVDTPALMTALPMVDMGEQTIMLLDPLGDLEMFLGQNIPGALDAMGSAFANVYGSLGKISKVTWDTLKKATAQGLRAIFDMLADEAFAELALRYATEAGKISMASLFNPMNLLKLAGLGAAYGTAKAAISGINSFDDSAVFKRGGQVTGNMSIGDTIIAPDAMKNLMKGNMGGKTVEVNVTFAGSYVGGSTEFRSDIDYLAERFALAMDNG